MNKISILMMGKALLKNFSKSSKTRAEQSVNIMKEVVEPQKVTSNQIEAYYRRYGKALERKPKQQIKESIKTNVNNKLEEKIQGEINAYNNRRFFEVSSEALKTLENNFDKKKNAVIKIILENSEHLPLDFVKMVKNIKTSEELAHAIRSFSGVVSNQIVAKYPKIYNILLKQHKISLKEQQLLNNINKKAGDIYIQILKAVAEPSKDKRVIQIENYLKTMYGIDYVHLESFEEAKNVLKAIKIAKQQNIPFPENLIVSPFQPYMAAGANVKTSKGHSIIFLSSKERKINTEEAYKKFTLPETKNIVEMLKQADKNYASTNHPLHNYIHEFCHSLQNILDIFPARLKPLPAKYQKTAEQVSEYANTSIVELEAELRTKSILSSLSEDEKALLDYFG